MQRTIFNQFILAVIFYSLVFASTSTAITVLINQKFGTGQAFVTAMLLQLLPRIVGAPWIAHYIHTKGVKYVTICGSILFMVLLFLLPHIEEYVLFQCLYIAMGLGNMACNTALFTFRTYVIPPNQNLSANAKFATITQLTQISAPAAAALALRFFAIKNIFFLLVGFLMLATLLLSSIPLNKSSLKTKQSDASTKKTSYKDLWKLLQQKPIVRYIFFPSLGYAFVCGTLKFFLICATTTQLQQTEHTWPFLLTINGVGALLASFLAPKLLSYWQKKQPLLRIYLGMRFLQVASLVALTWTTTYTGACICLFLAGAPETIASVCFFTLLQKNLTYQEEGLYHTLGLPAYNIFVLLGTSLCSLYTFQWLTLQQFWLVVLGLGASCSLPFFLLHTLRYAKIKASLE